MEKIVITSSKNLKESINYCLKKIEFNPNVKEFVLKPNICASYKSGSGNITNVKIVEVLIDLLLENYDAQHIYIAEGPSLVYEEPFKIFKKAGYIKLEKKYHNVSLIDIYQTEYEDLNFNFKVPKLLEGRCLINLPVLKGHSEAGFTCAIKNLKGLLRRSDKKKFHMTGLQKNLSSLVYLHPDLTIVDATVCKECEGDIFSKKYKFDLLICGKNPVLVDKICCKIVGINLKDIPYLQALIEKNKVEYQIIGNLKQLAEWKPYKNKFSYGKIDVYVGEACTGCVLAVCQAISPKFLIKRYSLGVVIGVFLSLFKKQRTSYIIGKDAKGIDNIKGKIIKFGNCAKSKKVKGTFLKGCPPCPEDIKKFL